MTTTLKIIAASKIWESILNQEWPAQISLDNRYASGNIHLIIYDEKEYLFEIKETSINNKIRLTGWLTGENKTGQISFEIQ